MRNLGQYFPLWARWISGAITLFALIMLLLAIVLGVRAGQQQLELKRRQQLSVIMQQALEFHNEGRIEAARIAYQEILIIDPNNVAAVDGLAQLRIAESAPAPRTLIAQDSESATSAPTLLPLPTITTTQSQSATAANAGATEFADAQEAFAAGRWSEVIDLLLPLRAANPTYEQAEVSELLFGAYVNLATEKDNQNKLQEALTLFDEALALQPNAIDIRAERTLIDYYIDAITYAEADWAAAIAALEAIYAQDPEYRDVKERLQEALRAESARLADAEEWCDAAVLLDEFIGIGITAGVVAQRDLYQKACDTGESATADGTGTPTALGTASADDESPADEETTTPTRLAASNPTSGAPTVGTILYSANDAASGRSRILSQKVGSSAGPTLLRDEAAQPALRDDGNRLLYRNLRNDMAGISAWDPGSDLLLRFTQYAEDTLPSWNPQNNQFVFASNREGDRLWRIYVNWADSDSQATVLSIGEAPAWHPTIDTIVFRGCDNSGNRCGLWQMNGSGSERAPLTDIPTDNRPAWSPDGRYVVFMSDGRTGNFDIYRVDTSSEQVLPLTDHATADLLPSVSPDGRWVAFVSNRDGSWKIWAVPISGGNATVVAPIVGTLGSWTEQSLQWVP